MYENIMERNTPLHNELRMKQSPTALNHDDAIDDTAKKIVAEILNWDPAQQAQIFTRVREALNMENCKRVENLIMQSKDLAARADGMSRLTF